MSETDPSATIMRTSTLTYMLHCSFDRRINVMSPGVEVADDLKVIDTFEIINKMNFKAQMVFHATNLYDALAPTPLEVGGIQGYINGMRGQK